MNQSPFSQVWLVGLITTVMLFAVHDSAAAPYQVVKPTDDEREELLGYYRLRPSEQLPALRRLPRAKQLRWIQLMRKYDPSLSWADQHGDHGTEFVQLLALNDSDTAQWLVRQYEEKEFVPVDVFRTLGEWHTGEGIAFVARRTISDEPFVPDGWSRPTSFQAANWWADQMLPNFANLPSSVRDWARNAERNRLNAYHKIMLTGGETAKASAIASDYVNYRGREVARLWWQANEKAILAACRT
jgi:hypothetical protein